VRALIAVLALLGLVIAARLGAYQLGLLPLPWEPFFGDGPRLVLHSTLSRALPIPDAVLGAAAYAVELGLQLHRSRRWALASGIVACAMAATGLALVLVQALAVHAFCTLCLASAAISWLILAPAVMEALAALRRHGDWRGWST
jgi:uncharacterized membrane protein